jgi:hypothetical protein
MKMSPKVVLFFLLDYSYIHVKNLTIIRLVIMSSIWYKEKLPDQWMESIIVPVHNKDDKTDCGNYRGT